jgi:hypothetical protein
MRNTRRNQLVAAMPTQKTDVTSPKLSWNGGFMQFSGDISMKFPEAGIKETSYAVKVRSWRSYVWNLRNRYER